VSVSSSESFSTPPGGHEGDDGESGRRASPRVTTPGVQPRSWWLALAALALCGPWPGWAPGAWQLAAMLVGLAILARPRGRAWLGWIMVAAAGILLVARPASTPRIAQWQNGLEHHCSRMLDAAEQVVTDQRIQRIFGATGEVVRPEMLFAVVSRAAGHVPGRTVFLADDRGNLVAWAGKRREYPRDMRPLGERRWNVVWRVQSGALMIREPILHEGRLVGAVTVVDRASRRSRSVWGMRAGWAARVLVSSGNGGSGPIIRSPRFPGVAVRVRQEPASEMGAVPAVRWWPWLGFILVAMAVYPGVAVAGAVVGGLSLAVAAGPVPTTLSGIVVLAAGAAVGRWIRTLSPGRGRWLALAGLAALPVSALLLRTSGIASWLPERAFQPGWGAAWMVAASWVAAGWWKHQREGGVGLDRRILVALAAVAAGLFAQLIHVPVQVRAAESRGRAPVLGHRSIVLDGILPGAISSCHLDDLAGKLAMDLGLPEWREPAMLQVISPKGGVISQWGDLSEAGSEIERLHAWTLVAGGKRVARAELFVASPPWGMLRDWRSWESVDRFASAPVWFAVMTRSGQVGATIHSGIPDLTPQEAGKLFHAGGGWTMVSAGGSRRLAHVRRQGEWLVTAIARYPSAAVWILRVLLALVWAMVGLAIAVPPVFRRDRVQTFGGRLRLLVAGAVVLPLVLLTVFLHQRLRQDGVRLEGVVAGDALQAARWTATHLAGGFKVDENLARWIGRQISGEVILFKGASIVAASRPDLVTAGRLPGLPAPPAYVGYMLGREAPVVLREGPWLVGAGGVRVQGVRYLLEVFPSDPLTVGGLPDVVDWLLTGAIVAALLALVVTSRVERQLGASLQTLVDLSGRVERGEPVGKVEPPAERDLAQVVDAVRLMSEEVQRRERDLKSQEELLRITLSTLAPAVIVYGSSGAVWFTNPSAKTLLSEHGELVWRVVSEAGGRTPDGEHVAIQTVQPFPGEDVTWRVGVADVPLPDGRRGQVAVLDDVSDVVQADRFRQLNQLARIVAHEVKNPLTPIRLWVQEIEDALHRGDTGLEDLLEEACAEISAQVTRLQNTAASFSNLVALERWEAEQVDLADLLRSILDGMKILQRRGISIDVDAPPDQVCTVVGDRSWLRRALTNVIQNSIDVLRGRGGEIHVRLRSRNGRTIVEVEDSGGGVPEDQLGELFNPRFSTTSAGTGLGLALVRHVIARCHGTVMASNGRQGLVIRIDLPETGRSSATI